MRIAYVINSVEGGGAALPVPAVTQVLRNHGATVEVLALTRRDGRALPAMRDAGLQVRVRDGGRGDHVAALAWLDAEVARWRPDLIWTSLSRATLLGQLVGRRRGVPVVSWQHNAIPNPVNRILLRATQRWTALWIGDSHSITALTGQRLGVDAARLMAWPLFAADAGAPQARAWRPGESLKLGTLGRLHPVKGHDVLIAALARLRAQGFESFAPFEVRIAGEGTQRAALEAALAAAGIENVHLVGFCDRPREFLADLHLYLQPSRSEGLCIAVHEAMQAGLPTLVTTVGELPFSVRDGDTGFLVPPNNPEALAKELAWMLSHPEHLAAMGVAARARVLERFGAEAFARGGADVVARLPIRLASGQAAGPGRSPSRRASGQSA